MTDDQTPRWRGIRTIGADFQISNLSITIGDDSNVNMGTATAKLRTDLWPFWVEDAIEAAEAACQFANQIPALVNQLDNPDGPVDQTESEIDRIMIRELRATMRAITASAFAIDAFYGTVKSRCGPHPHEAVWRKNGTPRKKRITETFRYHLRMKTTNEVKGVKSCIDQLFSFRDKAVHMASEFREPVLRSDALVSVDWHFHFFRRENAVNAVRFTIIVLNHLVSIMDRGSEEIAKCKPLAQERMKAILSAYEKVESLPPFEESEIPRQGIVEASGS